MAPRVGFKVPKAVPTWVEPFFTYVNNPKVFSLFEKHWESFFNAHFVPPKPRKPADPVKQFEKGVKGLATIMDSSAVSEDDKTKLSETVSQVISTLPDELKGAMVVVAENTVSGGGGSGRKRKRRSNSNSLEKLNETYNEARNKLLESKNGVDVEDVMRSLDQMYDAALSVSSENDSPSEPVVTEEEVAEE